MIDLTGRPHRLPEPALDLLRECWRQAVRHADPADSPPPAGLPELREQLGRLVSCPAERLVVISGVRAAIPVLGVRLAEVTVEMPSFEGVPAVMRALGHRVRRSAWSDLERGRGALWLTGVGRNPDGASLTAAQIQGIDAAGWHLVVWNDSYRWYGSPPPSVPPGWIRVGSFSKLLGPGMRIGWLCIDDPAAFEPHCDRLSCPPVPLQQAMASFLAQGGLRLLRPVVARVHQARAAFGSAVGTAVRGSVAESARAGVGPSMLVPVPPPPRSMDAALTAFESAGLAVGSGLDFCAPGAVRLCFSSVSPDEAGEAGSRYRLLVEDAAASAGLR